MTQAALLDQVGVCMSQFRSDRLRYQFSTNDFLPDTFPPELTREAEAVAIVTTIRERDPFVLKLIEALEEARNYIDGHIDVVDGSYGEPAPNRAMSLASTIDEALMPFEKVLTEG